MKQHWCYEFLHSGGGVMIRMAAVHHWDMILGLSKIIPDTGMVKNKCFNKYFVTCIMCSERNHWFSFIWTLMFHPLLKYLYFLKKSTGTLSNDKLPVKLLCANSTCNYPIWTWRKKNNNKLLALLTISRWTGTFHTWSLLRLWSWLLFSIFIWLKWLWRLDVC